MLVHEIDRQRAILESAPDVNTASVPQETRGFDEHRFETYKLRSKEDAPDYRYMPDPNLGELVLSKVCKPDFRAAVSAQTGLLGTYPGDPGRASGTSMGDS